MLTIQTAIIAYLNISYFVGPHDCLKFIHQLLKWIFYDHKKSYINDFSKSFDRISFVH